MAIGCNSYVPYMLSVGLVTFNHAKLLLSITSIQCGALKSQTSGMR